MPYRSDGERMRAFVKTDWGGQVLRGEVRYADNAIKHPERQFFEMMTLDAGGPYFMRVSDPETQTLSLLLKPLVDEAAFKAEHGAFMEEKWRKGDLWARCYADKGATVTLLEEENSGWRAVLPEEEDNLVVRALGGLSARKGEILERLIMRAGLQWGRESDWTSGRSMLSDGQTRQGAVLHLSGASEIDVWH